MQRVVNEGLMHGENKGQELMQRVVDEEPMHEVKVGHELVCGS